MRQVEKVNIKVNSLPTASVKKETLNVSKNDFKEKLESFLEKNKKTDTNTENSKEVSTKKSESQEIEDVEESEEDFEVALHLNSIELNQLMNQPVEVDLSLTGEMIERPEGEIVINDFKDLLNVTDAPTKEVIQEMVDVSDDAQIEKLLSKIETQLTTNPELTLKDIVSEIMSENQAETEENFDVFGNLEKNSQNEGLITSEIDVEIPIVIDQGNIPAAEPVDDTENIVLEADVDEVTTIDEIESTVSGLDQDVTLEEQPIDLLNRTQTFEPIDRMNFVQEVSRPVQQVTQEKFVSNVETLIIEQTEATNAADSVTTARMQLTPEHLGKVSLQIEMNGKELTAKLIVEQHETKEWIDQQVAHLKEKLLAQEVTVTEFQVVVDENLSDNRFMSNNEENPFFKQKEKDSQEKRKQRITKAEENTTPIQSERVQYADAKGISLFV